MKTILGQLAATLLALAMTSDLAAAQTRITVAVGGGACLCYLPTACRSTWSISKVARMR
jgi:NitT/TauT family transport system substrate-binding protein